MKAYTIKNNNDFYTGAKGFLIKDILGAKFYKDKAMAEAFKNELLNYRPEDKWQIISVNIEEIKEEETKNVGNV